MSTRNGEFEGTVYIGQAEELLAELASLDVSEEVVEKLVQVQAVESTEKVVEATKVEDEVQIAINDLSVSFCSLADLVIISQTQSTMGLYYGSASAVEAARQQLTTYATLSENSEVQTLIERRTREIEIVSTTTTKIQVIKTELVSRIEEANARETELREKAANEGIDSLLTEYQVCGIR